MMSATRRRAGAGAAGRWLGCLALVAGAHAAAVTLLLRERDPATPPPTPPAVLIDLPPLPDTPTPEPAPPVEEPPAPRAPAPAEPAPEPPPQPARPEPPRPEPPQPETPAPETPPPEPPPPPPEPPPPMPMAEVVLPTRPRPAVRPPPRPRAAAPRPPAVAPVAAPTQPAAPAPPAPAPSPAPAAAAPASNASPTWQAALLGRLQRAKRYPDEARSRGEEGVAYATFTMDRTGHILSVSLSRSSGVPALDEETLALIRRTDPLPPPPAEVAGATITLTVPVSFRPALIRSGRRSARGC